MELNWTLLQLAFCLYLTGVIWVIRLTHYPAFALIDAKHFERFHARHTAVMGGIVGPVMVFELATAVILSRSLAAEWLLNLAGVVLIWIVTFGLSVPAHNKLAAGQDQQVIRRLVQSNWIRTVIWTLRSIFLLALVLGAYGIH